ncbi:hypothetical protein MA16_Dca017682 [Dendrobium catenatum]|uniref:Uncharacterized protein n=1 Tax=Dendrobium catenatum TaxID=906689 RepID=A0A2I0XAB7_9ASPA|nr:hypothetical protein MA16_Dca017682 [Dendrobium catenatum]
MEDRRSAATVDQVIHRLPHPPSSRKFIRQTGSSPPAFGDSGFENDRKFYSSKERAIVINEGGLMLKKKVQDYEGKGKGILMEENLTDKFSDKIMNLSKSLEFDKCTPTSRDLVPSKIDSGRKELLHAIQTSEDLDRSKNTDEASLQNSDLLKKGLLQQLIEVLNLLQDEAKGAWFSACFRRKQKESGLICLLKAPRGQIWTLDSLRQSIKPPIRAGFTRVMEDCLLVTSDDWNVPPWKGIASTTSGKAYLEKAPRNYNSALVIREPNLEKVAVVADLVS